MKLTKLKSGGKTHLYVSKSYRTDDGRSTTKTVRKLGTVEELEKTLNGRDPIEWAMQQVAEMTKTDKEESAIITISLNPNAGIEKGKKMAFNCGYLFLQKIYHDLRLHDICKKIAKEHGVKYDLNGILQMMLYSRIIYPGSKQSSLEASQKFLERPECSIHQVYRALSLLAEKSDDIQAAVYRNSLKLGKRNTTVLYYDCTNYFFESEEECGLRQYGHSKENRPNPIVQMGLFMDMDGFPLAFTINPGNTNEQVTLKPLEQKLNDRFGISKLVVCTDGGLSSCENRKFNDVGNRAFITVQSLKKLKKHLQDWALSGTGWHIAGSDRAYNLDEVDAVECRNVLFYKERWMNENGLAQRIIVTFSFKYMAYLRHVRNRQVERAEQMLKRGAGKLNNKSMNDPKRFIQSTNYTPDGEIAQAACYSLNEEMIAQEDRFDGFYAVCTDLEAPAMAILKANNGRWIIENGFRIMKTEFEARPVFLQRDDRIKAHFLTCFLALLLYKYLETNVNKGMNHFTTEDIVSTLRNMYMKLEKGATYTPAYERTDLTDTLHELTGFRTDREVVSKKKMREIISLTKNSRSSQQKAKEQERQ